MTNRRKFMQLSSVGIGLSILLDASLFGGIDKLPNILILGDSISIGYTNLVRKKLEGRANVFRTMKKDGNPWNCQGTTNGVKYLDVLIYYQNTTYML